MAFDTYNMDDLLSGKEAAAAARVSQQTISYWAAKGYLKDQSEGIGRPRYRRGDVLDAERDTRRNPRSSRSTVRRSAQRAA